MDDRVVITGIGLVSSLGQSASETWDALLSGKCGIRPINDFNAHGFDCRAAALVHGLGPDELGIHPRDSRIMNRHSYMLMKCGRDAFRGSQLDKGLVTPEDIGYFAGMGMVDYSVDELLPAVRRSIDEKGCLAYNEFFSHAYTQIHPLWPLSMLNNISFCQVGIDLGIKGENTTFSPHADSGLHAVIEAYNTVLEKKAKVVIAGGVSEVVSPMSLGRALWSGLLSVSAEKSEASCRPFGKDRNGTILGEGCGMMALELKSSAEERHVPCLAAVSGYGASFEKGADDNCPASGAISLAMRNAIDRAGIKPHDIDLLIAHGDGTFAGDKNEIEAIHDVFSDHVNKLNVYSTKGALGHMLAGAPVVDAVLGIHMIRHGIIPAVYNCLPVDDGVKFNLVSNGPLRADPKRILINSRSSEGQCASLIIEAV